MRDQIQKIMNNFDFEKVHNIMKFLNWTWFPQNTIPTIDKLKQETESLLIQISTHPEYKNISTGGFEVTIDKQTINLRFIVEEYFTII